MTISSGQPPNIDKSLRYAGRQIRIRNNTGSTIPPNSFVEVTSASSGAFIVVKPTKNSLSPARLAITGAAAIPSGRISVASPAQAGKLWVRFSGLAPKKGDDFGTSSSSFQGVRNKNGFEVNAVSGSLVAITAIPGGFGFDPTVFGFIDRDDSSLSWNDVTLTLTISATGTNKNDDGDSIYEYVFAGERRIKIGSDSVTIDSTDGIWYLSYNAADELVASQTVWVFKETTQVARIYWNNALSDGVPLDERHEHVMDTATHEMEHDVEGTKWLEGGDISGFSLLTKTDAGITFGLSQVTIRDEDIIHIISPVADGDTIQVFYRDGAAGTWRWDTEIGFAYLFNSDGSDRVDFNKLNGTWARTEPTDNRYVIYWVGWSNSFETDFKTWSLMGQDEYTTLAAAQDVNVATDLSIDDFPFVEEGLFAFKIILRTKNSFGGTMSAQIEEVTDIRAARDLPSGVTLIPSHNAIPDRDKRAAHPSASVHEVGMGELFYGTAGSVPGGWVICQGGTIGDAGSGASARANVDTQDLFVHLYDDFSNAQLAVSGGRGADAETDFDAGKTIELPDLRQRFPLGLGVTDHSILGETEGVAEGLRSPTDHNHGLGAAGTSDPGDHTHSVPSTDNGTAHTHGNGTLATDSDAHTHAGTTDMAAASLSFSLVDVRADQIDISVVAQDLSALGHSHDFTTDSDAHTHSITGALDTESSHTHTNTDPTGDAGAHTHTLTGNTDTLPAFPDYFVVNFILSLGAPPV